MGFGYALVQLLCILLVQFFEMSLEPALAVPRYAAGWAYMCLLAWGRFAGALHQKRIVRNRSFSQGFAALVNVKIYLDVLTVPATYVVPMFSTASGLFFARVAAVVLGSASTFLRGARWCQDAEPASDPLPFHQCGAESFSFLLCL